MIPNRTRSLSPLRRRGTLGFAIVAVALVGPIGIGTSGAANPTPVARAFGANAYGELGNGSTADSSTPVAVSALSGDVRVAAAARHSLAIMGDGSVKSWGRNTVGELGNGSTTNRSTPFAVSGFGAGSGVIAVAGGAAPITTTSPSGDGHSMALKADRTVWAWGNNTTGEQGNGSATGPDLCGTTPCGKIPRRVTSLSGMTRIAAGGSFDMALKSDGTVWAWGNNKSGQLGLDPLTGPSTCLTSTPCSKIARKVPTLSGVSEIAAGASFGVALKAGTVWTWGNNQSGQLGNGAALPGPDMATPHAVSGATGVVAIAAGAAFVIAVKSDHSVVAWGNGTSGELGDGGTADSSTPQAVSTLGAGSGVIAVTAGFSHALALKGDGSLLAWGHNRSGQLGDGASLPGADVLTPEVTGVSAAQVSAGGSHTLVSGAPIVDAAPSAGPPGTSVTMRGRGYSPGETVSVAYRTKLASPSELPVCSDVVGSDSTFSCSGNLATSNLGPVGAHLLIASGGTSGFEAVTSFVLVPPPVTVTPNAGPAGTHVTITGSHLAPSESVSVVWLTKLASPTTLALCAPTTTVTGTFSCTATIPSTNVGPLGAHTIRATGAVSKLPGTTTFTRTPKLSVTPTSGPKATHVTVSGSNFASGEKVAVVWLTKLASPSSLALCTATVASTGTFSCTATIPSTNAGPVGVHTIRATGAVSKVPANTTFTLQ